MSVLRPHGRPVKSERLLLEFRRPYSSEGLQEVLIGNQSGEPLSSKLCGH